MPIHPDTLSSLAGQYTLGMSSIRGRRVQRLLKREFAGADEVLLVTLGAGTTAVLGRSTTGAAFCATDGRGRYAAVFRWLHDSTRALETHFDLLKDSLPVLASRSVSHPAGPGPVGGQLQATLGVAECLHADQMK
ncbi:MAG: hypothetical protein IV092_01330 [Burkholderiaceae bacterium]|nr:hypothetical protein [Burkholderiaceae bacterium]